ncbi:hypothetical protein [Synechococcus phage BUCT-ZZ01]|nr:hypothetical protein [Synechococcus phage BUCT-ZZ01]
MSKKKQTEKTEDVIDKDTEVAFVVPEKLSTHFSTREFTKSQTGIRLGIRNNMNKEQFENAKALCENVLEPVRKYFGVTNINSGFRGPELNKAVGGEPTSQHQKGEAADIECAGVDNYTLALYIKNALDFDQLILEYYIPGVRDSGWVHVSYRRDGKNRKQVLTKQKGKPYQQGLIK